MHQLTELTFWIENSEFHFLCVDFEFKSTEKLNGFCNVEKLRYDLHRTESNVIIDFALSATDDLHVGVIEFIQFMLHYMLKCRAINSFQTLQSCFELNFPPRFMKLEQFIRTLIFNSKP